MAAAEKMAESIGVFAHAENWHHLYNFIGYCLFIEWMNEIAKKSIFPME
ncbi:hypothetical protein [Cytobacillus firmus]